MQEPRCSLSMQGSCVSSHFYQLYATPSSPRHLCSALQKQLMAQLLGMVLRMSTLRLLVVVAEEEEGPQLEVILVWLQLQPGIVQW